MMGSYEQGSRDAPPQTTRGMHHRCMPLRLAIIQCVTPGPNRSDKSVAVAAAPRKLKPCLGSTSKISCMVRRKEEWEYWIVFEYGTPFTFLCASLEMMMKGSVLLGSSPPSLSSHHRTISPW